MRYKLIDTDPDKSKEFIRKGSFLPMRVRHIVYYDMSNAIIILYDVTDKDSFADAQFWRKSIREQCVHSPPILLVGNKADLKERRAVTKEEAERYAKENGMHFFEVSAKDATSIDGLLTYITSQVLNPTTKSKGEETEKKFLLS